MRTEAPSFYDVLGVEPTATQQQLDDAWKQLVREHHPDHASPDEITAATARTAAINQAYQTLRDPMSRYRYDRREGIGRLGWRQGREKFAMRTDEAIDALVRLHKERQAERIRVVGAAALGAAAVIYSLRALKLI